MILSWVCTVPFDTKEIGNGSRILHSALWTTEMKTGKLFRPVKHSAEDAGNETASRLTLAWQRRLQIWLLGRVCAGIRPFLRITKFSNVFVRRALACFGLIGTSVTQVGPKLLALNNFVWQINCGVVFRYQQCLLLNLRAMFYAAALLSGRNKIRRHAVTSS